jgi:hypothetical protein
MSPLTLSGNRSIFPVMTTLSLASCSRPQGVGEKNVVLAAELLCMPSIHAWHKHQREIFGLQKIMSA